MWLYDLLALFRNVRMHRMLGKRAVLEAEPMLRERGLRGGARFYDAQCDDARLVLATARSAMHHGALVANYTAVLSLERTAGRVVGAQVEDRLTDTRATIRASVVVNATGPWADRVRTMEDAGVARMLQPTKGVHILVDRSRLDHRDGIIFLSPIDGRVLFILPWRDLSYIGTTDTDTTESPDQLEVTPEEMVYLLRSVNALFPNARLGLEDVRGAWAGLRPLLTDSHGEGGERALAGACHRAGLGRHDHRRRREAHHLSRDGQGGSGPRGARAAIPRRPAPRGRDRHRRGGAARRRDRRLRRVPGPRDSSWAWSRRASSIWCGSTAPRRRGSTTSARWTAGCSAG